MKINFTKTKVMKFNTSKVRDFPVRLHFNDDKFLEVVENCKLLGILISSDLKWTKNTKQLIKKAMTNMWILRRLKHKSVTVDEMLEVYKLKIRSMVELACPVWHSSITVKEKNDIERVQKTAFHIILGESYESYSSALEILGLEKLEKRREKQCLRFAKKFSEDNRHKNKFVPNTRRTRISKSKKFHYPKSRTTRYRKSSIPYFIGLLNQSNLSI